MRVLIPLGILTAILVTTSPAQIANGDSVLRAYSFKGAPSATNPASDDSTANELLVVIGLKASMQEFKRSFVARRIQSDPRWVPYRDVLQQWADEVFDWNKFETFFVPQLIPRFTRDEMLQIVKFYQNPELNQKLSPDLTQRRTREKILQIIKFHQSPVGKKWNGMKFVLQQDMMSRLNAADQRFRSELRRRVQQRSVEIKQPVPN